MRRGQRCADRFRRSIVSCRVTKQSSGFAVGRDAQIRYIDRRRRAPAHLISRGEGLRHIGDEIVGMLNAD
jgi:hypothetical protein